MVTDRTARMARTKMSARSRSGKVVERSGSGPRNSWSSRGSALPDELTETGELGRLEAQEETNLVGASARPKAWGEVGSTSRLSGRRDQGATTVSVPCIPAEAWPGMLQ